MKRHVDTAPHGRANPASVKTITENTALREIANQFQHAPFLAVDTEFMRERTYYPQLCLVQISNGTTAVAIDLLAKGLDFAPFGSLCAMRPL